MRIRPGSMPTRGGGRPTTGPSASGRKSTRRTPAEMAIGTQQLKPATQAVGALYDRAIDAVLLKPRTIRTADEALEVLKADASWNADGLASQIQKTALIVTPLLRRFRVVR